MPAKKDARYPAIPAYANKGLKQGVCRPRFRDANAVHKFRCLGLAGLGLAGKLELLVWDDQKVFRRRESPWQSLVDDGPGRAASTCPQIPCTNCCIGVLERSRTRAVTARRSACATR